MLEGNAKPGPKYETVVIELEFDYCEECGEHHGLNADAASLIRTWIEQSLDEEKERVLDVLIFKNSKELN